MSIESELLQIRGNSEFWVCEEVVAWARSHPKSALYKAPVFCGFDLKKSAYEHWLWGARSLIALHVRMADGTRAAVSLSLDRSRKGGGYRAVEDVLRDKGLYEIMLQDALNELNRVEAKYDMVKQLRPVWKAAAKVRRGRGTKQMKGGAEKRASA